jgi:phage-related minor tail protein
VADIASLGISIDTRDVAKAEAALDGLSSAGAKTEASAKGVGAAWSSVGKNIGSASSAINSASASVKRGNDSIKAQQAELGKLLGQINPVVAAFERLDEQERKLGQFKASGVVDLDTFREYKARIDASRASLTGFDDTARKVGISAKQTSQALRQLPAQFSDIAISLQGGQNPLSVFLQQGSQIKDSFGGVGPALRETGKYALGLVNPFTVAAAAVVALGVAYDQGSEEAVAYNKAIVLTGNSAGLTASSLAAMAVAQSQLNGTQGQAAAVLSEVASAGKFTSDQIQGITVAAIAMEKATGKAVGDTVSEFKRLADEPAAASAKLNEQYHYLTASVYSQIRALEDQGDAAGAAQLAIETYGTAMDQRAADIKESLGAIETAWNAVAGVASKAWDAMLNVGREDTLEDKLDGVQAKLARAAAEQSGQTVTSRFGNFGGGLAANSAGNLQGQLQDILQAEVDSVAKARQEMFEASNQQAGIVAFGALQDGLDKARSKSELLVAAIKKIDEQVAAARKSGLAVSETDVSKLKAAAAEQYKETEPKAKKAPRDKDAEASAREAKRLNDLYTSNSAQLEKQVALFGKNSAAASLQYDIESGGLAKLSPEQKQHLIELQAELDARNNIVDIEKLRVEILRKSGQIAAANDASQDLEYAQKIAEYERTGNVEALQRLETLRKIDQIQQKAKLKDGTVEGVSQAPKAKGVDAAVGGANSEIERLNEEARELESWRDDELDRQAAFLEAKAINEETYAERVANINMQAKDGLAKIDKVKNQTILDSSVQFFEQAAVLSQSGNKRLNAIGKAAAIASATISGFKAVANALEIQPYPVGLALAVSAGVVAAANVANIAGVEFKTGGYTGDGNPNDVAGIVHAGEYVMTAEQTRRIGVGNLQALATGQTGRDLAAGGARQAQMANAGAGGTTVINNSMSFPGISDRREAKAATGQAAKKIASAVRNSGRYT